jgi:hypothetical protein
MCCHVSELILVHVWNFKWIYQADSHMVKLSRRGCWCLSSVPPNNCPPTKRWCTLEGNKCACVRFRGELRVVTTHPESIHTVLSLTMLLEIAHVFILCSSRTPTPTESRPSVPHSQHHAFQ